MTKYLVFDVFSETPFGGNQLAVIPDATGIAERDLQSIAREFNFSETTFVYPPNDPANTARVRIFTPTMEVPFAGHPTIGTAIALAHLGHGPGMVLELGIGPIAAHATKKSAQFTTTAPLEILASPAVDEIANALGIGTDKIVTRTHAPQIATLGLPFCITELTDLAALGAIETNIAAFRNGAAKYPGALDFAQFAYVRDADRPDIIHARMFAPLDNIPEDPATGSASATLGALLADISRNDQSFTIHQGDDMGRPSRIGVQTIGAQTHETAVTIRGAACQTMEGRLIIA